MTKSVERASLAQPGNGRVRSPAASKDIDRFMALEGISHYLQMRGRFRFCEKHGLALRER